MTIETILQEYNNGTTVLKISRDQIPTIKLIIDTKDGYIPLDTLSTNETSRSCLVMSLVDEDLFLERVRLGYYTKPTFKKGAYIPKSKQAQGSWNLYIGDKI